MRAHACEEEKHSCAPHRSFTHLLPHGYMAVRLIDFRSAFFAVGKIVASAEDSILDLLAHGDGPFRIIDKLPLHALK